MKESFDTVKSEKKIRVDLLRAFLDQVKACAKMPENLVKMSVHGRLITRGDSGEVKALIDKKEGRLNRPSGEN
jgi:hypothetical protein